MSSITNINNNSAVVNVGRTTPVSPGQQPASRSIPVVLASDQAAVPVEEQNKVQSEVALSLLGIPRAEVALGIFADVNTYDVNPTEWSKSPQAYVDGHGVKHLPTEAGALVEAPRNKSAVLTSKRFFRYQPGRVSAATFGVKSTVSQKNFSQNPVVRKFGIYDNFDGYFWETRNNGKGDNFSVVRRTQSLLNAPTSPFGSSGQVLRGANVNSSTDILDIAQLDDYRIIGKAATAPVVSPDYKKKDRKVVQEARFTIANAALAAAASGYGTSGTDSNGRTYYEALAFLIYGSSFTADQVAIITAKCKRDVDYWLDFILLDMEWGGNAHVIYNTYNFRGQDNTGTNRSILPDSNTFEKPVYDSLKVQIDNLGLTDDEAGTLALVDQIIAYYATAQSDPVYSSANLGSKTKIDTLYDVKAHYWGYWAAKAISYDMSLVPSGFTEADIKFKCQRDTKYLVDGYKNDIVGGGNAETVYNASMYMKASGLSIYSQLDGSGQPIEVTRQTALKAEILHTLTEFGYSSSDSVYTRQSTLADLIIGNFTVESTEKLVVGNRGFAGNLVCLRDGLLMTHAAAFDTSLLKTAESIVTVTEADNVFRLSKGIVTFGQHVRHVSGISELTNGQVYKIVKVIGPKGNEFTLQEEDGTAVTVAASQSGFFETVVPFIFPTDYDPEHYAGDGASSRAVKPNSAALADVSKDADPFVQGMTFPLMYSSNDNLRDDSDGVFKIGYINTASSDLETDSQLVTRYRTQIDDVNFIPEYINWIKNNVKPEFWGVYEYRIPRSRFSHDKLDGITGGTRVYSDRATGEGGQVNPGEIVTDADDNAVAADSEYNFDFSKVTMLKIEFSWYGAVGALFLAYVPIGNGEARWVRVHHLRASNQLKIASLGNATLPITYTTYGGGDQYSLGDGEDANTPVGANYSTTSHNIVKYGASYYIDGGDRGTVRLYSHNNDQLVSAFGKQFTASGYSASGGTVTVTTPNSIPAVFFMGAKVSTNNATDQNITVVWASGTTCELSGPLTDQTNITLIPDRAASVFGIETKREILSTVDSNAVRNRVQVYPTKLSTSNLSTSRPVRLRMKKTPIFQTDVTPSGTLTINASYDITSENLPLPVTESATYLQNDETVYGWLQALVGVNEISAFGRLYKESGSYYFELLESYNGIVTLKSSENFLADGVFTAQGLTGSSNVGTKSSIEKEGLSSVTIATNNQVPIPGTGINIATLYLQQGTEQIDLSAYFDYNKEYLSFPLTDVADTLYFAVDTDSASSNSDDVSLGCTWEEQ